MYILVRRATKFVCGNKGCSFSFFNVGELMCVNFEKVFYITNLSFLKNICAYIYFFSVVVALAMLGANVNISLGSV